MRILLFGQRLQKEDGQFILDLIQLLKERKAEIIFYADFYQLIKSTLKLGEAFKTIDNHKDLVEFNPDFVISLGGDGTILNAASFIRDSGIALLGINMGRLGFLSSIEKSYIEEALQSIEEKSYKIEDRILLKVDSDPGIFVDYPYGLNDFTLHKRDTSSMVIIHVYIDDDFLNSYWADGIILATPAGSTAYSLSCGGPIVFPKSNNFVITPVAPHALTARPIIIPDSSKVSFSIEGRSDNYLATVDSRFATITAEHKIEVSKGSFSIRMIQLEEFSFMKTIHNKLNWGRDTRN